MRKKRLKPKCQKQIKFEFVNDNSNTVDVWLYEVINNCLRVVEVTLNVRRRAKFNKKYVE